MCAMKKIELIDEMFHFECVCGHVWCRKLEEWEQLPPETCPLCEDRRWSRDMRITNKDLRDPDLLGMINLIIGNLLEDRDLPCCAVNVLAYRKEITER